jgi:hypothetical protein
MQMSPGKMAARPESRGPWQRPDSVSAAALGRFIFSMQMDVHFVRQTVAKLNQILSAAAPDSFIFCHSSAHSCIRLRDAGGKAFGCGGVDESVDASLGMAGFAGAGGD